MQVLRQGGEHLEAREYWRWVALAVVVLAALGSLAFTLPHIVISDLPLSLAPLTPILLALIVAGRAVYRITPRIRAARKGRLGETLVTNLLSRLPDDYYLVNDIVLGAGNIDHVVIGPCGVIVIETKRIAGKINCEGDQWFVNGRRTKSYSRQAKAAAMAVRTYLAVRYPEMGHQFVQAVLVFTDPLCELRVNRAQVAVARFSELLQLITEFSRSGRMDRSLAQASARSLADVGGAPALTRPWTM
jgi:hypothetical protein